jgi:hypothetical protein
MEKFLEWLLAFGLLSNQECSSQAISSACLAGAAILNKLVGPGGEEEGDVTLTKMGQLIAIISAAMKYNNLAVLDQAIGELQGLATHVAQAHTMLNKLYSIIEQASPALERGNRMVEDYGLRDHPLLLLVIADASHLFSEHITGLIQAAKALKISSSLEQIQEAIDAANEMVSGYSNVLTHIELRLGEEARKSSGLGQPTTGQA